MKLQASPQTLPQPMTKPVVEPSVPHPQPDPLHGVRDIVEAIRHESTQAPREYLDETRSVLGAE